VLKDAHILYLSYITIGNGVGSKGFEPKNWFKALPIHWFCIEIHKEVRENFDWIKSTNLNAKSMDERNFEPIFGFKALWIYPPLITITFYSVSFFYTRGKAANWIWWQVARIRIHRNSTHLLLWMMDHAQLIPTLMKND
jgi:hypothetical protein